jgi:hypothetical protein
LPPRAHRGDPEETRFYSEYRKLPGLPFTIFSVSVLGCTPHFSRVSGGKKLETGPFPPNREPSAQPRRRGKPRACPRRGRFGPPCRHPRGVPLLLKFNRTSPPASRGLPFLASGASLIQTPNALRACAGGDMQEGFGIPANECSRRSHLRTRGFMAKVQKKSAAVSRRPARESRARKTAPARQTAWWLSADVEVCVFCHQEYAYGTGYRCAGCDAAVCAFCIAERRKEFWCPEC